MHLLVALGLTCATVLIHAVGTMFVVHLNSVWQRKKASPGIWASGIMIVRVVSTLLLLHLVEAVVWAVFYVISGLFPGMETAIYFSITSYTTVGYGDVTLTAPWRLLGPIEAAVGILMFGWSTGVMVTAIGRIHADRVRVRNSNSEARASDN